MVDTRWDASSGNVWSMERITDSELMEFAQALKDLGEDVPGDPAWGEVDLADVAAHLSWTEDRTGLVAAELDRQLRAMGGPGIEPAP